MATIEYCYYCSSGEVSACGCAVNEVMYLSTGLQLHPHYQLQPAIHKKKAAPGISAAANISIVDC